MTLVDYGMEKALVGAFSMIVKSYEPLYDEALIFSTLLTVMIKPEFESPINTAEVTYTIQLAP